MKKTLLFLILTLVLGLALAAGLALLPYGGPHGPQVEVEIPKGASLKAIAAKLQQQGLVPHALAFRALAQASGKAKSFQSGRYLVEGQPSLWGLVQLLASGKVQQTSVTLPEGINLNEAFALLEQKGFPPKPAFGVLARNSVFIASLGLPPYVTSLEGFLFPETYQFPSEADEKLILKTLVATFKQRIPADYETQAQAVGLTWYEAVILASIIEKETSKGFERPLISSVFHNRLKKKMRLQTDPTVIYGIPNYKGNITRADLVTPHPYNTYVIFGLPPTPIANPGLDSLLAAVRPDPTPYLFFVAKGDGTHEFTTNFADHNAAVTRFQRKRTKDYRSH